jgi:hypothetical protein
VDPTLRLLRTQRSDQRRSLDIAGVFRQRSVRRRPAAERPDARCPPTLPRLDAGQAGEPISGGHAGPHPANPAALGPSRPPHDVPVPQQKHRRQPGREGVPPGAPGGSSRGIRARYSRGDVPVRSVWGPSLQRPRTSRVPGQHKTVWGHGWPPR